MQTWKITAPTAEIVMIVGFRYWRSSLGGWGCCIVETEYARRCSRSISGRWLDRRRSNVTSTWIRLATVIVIVIILIPNVDRLVQQTKSVIVITFLFQTWTGRVWIVVAIEAIGVRRWVDWNRISEVTVICRIFWILSLMRRRWGNGRCRSRSSSSKQVYTIIFLHHELVYAKTVVHLAHF